MAESIKSRYKPSYPKKYKGNPNNIICRSSWERKFCTWCDLNENILEWGSEEFSIKYFDPVKNKVRRYYPDFIIKVAEKTGSIKTYVIEIKPKKQTMPPNPNPKKKTRSWLNEVYTWETNNAKWKAADEFCKDHLLEFKIITEDELGIK